ncbi:MAG: type III-A CRISPR-associated RAMP protein Csm5 [Nitrospinae bacterium]|nr:type III-A CRISPR-associated RAMP protein Csm5 [Nitrospinota bacterium]
MQKSLKIRLHVLSPIHIGCDDVYEPMSFVIDEKKQKLIDFDPLDFIKSLSSQDRQKFTEICMQGTVSSIVSIYKFIAGRPVTGREVEIATGLLSHYKRVKELSTYGEKKIKQELNQFAVSRTAYNPHSNLPYIPGSSLKGSLRTAYLSKLAKDKRIKGRMDRAKDLEIELLDGSFATDPFRLVKVSDFLAIGEVTTRIVYVVNKKKKTSKFEARGPFQILETIKEGAIFEGIINIQQPEQESEIIRPIQANEFLKSINDFYIPAANEENKITAGIGSGSIVVKRINERFKDKLGKTAFLFRIGRHSGAEAVTIEGNRWIKISPPRKPVKFSDKGATTIWLASETSKPNTNNGLLPLGWAVMEVVNAP